MNNGMYDQAIKEFGDAVKSDPKNSQAYYNRTLTYQAIGNLSKAIELCPRCPESYNRRAFAYFKKEEYDKSWDDVHKLEAMGHRLPAKFLQDLRKYSGREK